jgi:hypothetical protein
VQLRTNLREIARFVKHRLPYLPAVWYWRRRRDREVERTPPVQTAAQDDRNALCVVYLTGKKHVPDLLYAAKSFVARFPGSVRLVILGDSSLTETELVRIYRHLPNSRVWTRGERDVRVIPLLKERGFEKCLQFREQLVFAARLIDVCLVDKADAFLWLDTDTLAFRPLNGMIQTLETSNGAAVFGRDPNNAYVFSLAELKERFGNAMPPHCNAGTCFLQRKLLDLAVLERWLSIPDFPMGNSWAEQTLVAALAGRGLVAYFPEGTISMGRGRDESACEFIHYCGMKPGPVEMAMLKVGHGIIHRQLIAARGHQCPVH